MLSRSCPHAYISSYISSSVAQSKGEPIMLHQHPTALIIRDHVGGDLPPIPLNSPSSFPPMRTETAISTASHFR